MCNQWWTDVSKRKHHAALRDTQLRFSFVFLLYNSLLRRRLLRLQMNGTATEGGFYMVGKDIPRHRRDSGGLVLSGKVSLGLIGFFLFSARDINALFFSCM
jgi:hypothetical protein